MYDAKQRTRRNLRADLVRSSGANRTCWRWPPAARKTRSGANGSPRPHALRDIVFKRGEGRFDDHAAHLRSPTAARITAAALPFDRAGPRGWLISGCWSKKL